MNFPTAVTTCFRKYWNTDGRASRSEYWYWTLFIYLGGIPFNVADVMLNPSYRFAGPLGVLFTLVTFLPSLFVSVRRLHDVNRSGYWILIAVTGIGLIPLLYWSIRRGTAGENDFGADPLANGHTGAKTAA